MAMVSDRIQITEGHEEIFDVKIDLSSSWCKNTVLSVTIAWMDKPGFPYCTDTCLVNDVDLFITKKDDNGNKKYYPNGGMHKDYKNTVERIRINNVQHGDFFHVHVFGANFEDSQTVQNVSLVCTGCFDFDNDPHNHHKNKNKAKKKQKNKKKSKGTRDKKDKKRSNKKKNRKSCLKQCETVYPGKKAGCRQKCRDKNAAKRKKKSKNAKPSRSREKKD